MGRCVTELVGTFFLVLTIFNPAVGIGPCGSTWWPP